MKVRWNFEIVRRVVSTHASTIVFAVGLTVLCASVAQWSGPLAGSIAGVTLMVIGGAPAYLVIARGRARKD